MVGMEQIMKIIKSNNIKKSDIGERRFRVSIYVDIFVPETDNLETDRESATAEAEEIVRQIPHNSYVGGVAYYTPRLDKPLDRDI
jgi:hypothetical protein